MQGPVTEQGDTEPGVQQIRCRKCQRPLAYVDGLNVVICVSVLRSTGAETQVNVRCRHSKCKHEQPLPFSLVPRAG
jgi:hypothetical protein